MIRLAGTSGEGELNRFILYKTKSLDAANGAADWQEKECLEEGEEGYIAFDQLYNAL